MIWHMASYNIIEHCIARCFGANKEDSAFIKIRESPHYEHINMTEVTAPILDSQRHLNAGTRPPRSRGIFHL